MQSSNIPSKIPLPFGYAAGAGYINTIPTASQIGIVDGRASLHDGFPPDTFDPISTGGVPPWGGDFNGILNEITSITQWQQAGGFFAYDSVFSTAVTGYPKGAILQSANFAGLWLSTAENNTTNPDTGGAGWVSLAFEGLVSVPVTSTSVTLTQLQSAYPIIVATGILTGATNLIFPAIVGEWIVVNNTTGAYTLTAKTASGTGVTLTQSASTYIYGDSTNIYFSDSAKVASFNGRTGTVSLTATDVTNALGYVPVQPNGTGATGNWGINISGNAATVTNGVYTIGTQTIGGSKTFSSLISGSIDGNSASVTNGVYTVNTQTINGSKTFGNTILLANGGFMFSNDPAQDTGISWASDGVMNVVINGVTTGQFTRLGYTGNSATATNVAYSGLTGTVPTWNQNTTGNAATSTNATTAYNQSGGTVNATTGTFSGLVYLANSGFTFSSEPASDTGISWASDGVMNVRINGVTTGQFTGAGYTGNSATATTATNQSGGSVNATSGDFSGTLNGVRGNFKNYSDLQPALTLTNATYGYNKYFRVDNTNQLSIINSAFTAPILGLTDGGDLSVSGTVSGTNLFASPNQTQQNFMGLVGFNTVYGNPYPYSIQISFSSDGGGGAYLMQAIVGGVTVGVSGGSGNWSQVSFICPPTQAWQVVNSGGSGTVYISVLKV